MVINRFIRTSLLALLAALPAAAAPDARPGPAPLTVVTTIFPLYDWARAVGGTRVTVTTLLPPGVEAHAFAPRPSDVLTLNRADLFIYLGPAMEPWAADLLAGMDRSRPRVITAGRAACAHAPGADDHTHAEDPHVWLDPVLAQPIVRAIADGFTAADPDGSAAYATNAAAYIQALQALDTRIANGLRTLRHRDILYAGHFAFGCFAQRYGLTHRSPYTGFSPNAAPTPRQIAAIIDAVRASGQTTIFHEELLDPRVGRVIAEETGARLEVLHGAHNLTKAEWARGDVTYLGIMDANLAKLRAALGAAP